MDAPITPTPTPPPGKGNYTTGRRYLEEGVGNRSPLEYRRINRKHGEDNVIPDLNAEATYNEYWNHKAVGHLNELHQHLENLHASTGNPEIAAVKTHVTNLFNKMSDPSWEGHIASKPNVLHPDIVAGVDAVGRHLDSIAGAVPEHAVPHLHGAINAALDYTETAHPAYEATHQNRSKATGMKPDEMTVMMDPEYRAHFGDVAGKKDAPYEKNARSFHVWIDQTTKEMHEGITKPMDWKAQMRSSKHGEYALIKQGLISNPEASRSDESRARTAERRKELSDQKKEAAKAAANKEVK